MRKREYLSMDHCRFVLAEFTVVIEEIAHTPTHTHSHRAQASIHTCTEIIVQQCLVTFQMFLLLIMQPLRCVPKLTITLAFEKQREYQLNGAYKYYMADHYVNVFHLIDWWSRFAFCSAGGFLCPLASCLPI